MESEDGNRCWVALVYDWGDDGLPIARTSDANILRLVKTKVLKEAQNRLSISKEIDEVVAILDEAELKRLQAVLDILIRPEAEELVLSQDGKEAKSDS